MNDPCPREPAAHIVLIDDLDAADLGVTTAIDALRSLEQLLDAQPHGLDIGSRSIAPLLRCIHQTAIQGWPLPSRH